MDNQVLQFFAIYFSISGSIFVFFESFGNSISKGVQKNLGQVLTNLSSKKVSISNNSIYYFSRLFDKVYTVNHFSLKCFIRSSISSSILFFILWMILFFRLDVINDNRGDFQGLATGIFYMTGLIFLIILIPSYFSLYITRNLIYYISTSKNLLIKVLILFIDLVSTILIFVVTMYLTAATESFFHNDNLTLLTSIENFNKSFFLNIIEEISDGFWIFTNVLLTFFIGTIWLWIFLISSSTLKLLNKVNPRILSNIKIFDIKDKPFKAIGSMAIILFSLIYFLWGFILLLKI